MNNQVHSDNNASEVDSLGHSGTFWDNSEDVMMSLERLNCFPVNDWQSFLTIFTHNRLIKKTRTGRTHGLIEMRGRI